MRSTYPRISLFLSPFLLAVLLLAAVPVSSALAGDCDGTAASDPPITCSTSPVGDTDIGLGLGDDILIVDPGVHTGEIHGDGTETGNPSTGDGGDDVITINGAADAHLVSNLFGDNVTGNGGDDTITINGFVNHFVTGDNVSQLSGGFGGNDIITVNGSVSGYVHGDYTLGDGGADIISITSTGTVIGVTGDSSGTSGNADTITVDGHVQQNVAGDSVDGDGGADMIIINGVVNGDVLGDDVTGAGGADMIIINGVVNGDVLGDEAAGAGGADTVILGVDSMVAGTIDGEDGADILKFNALTAAQVLSMGLVPGGDTATINCHKYTWTNFETLLGLASSPLSVVCESAATSRSLHVYFASDSVLAIESDAGDGFSVFAEHGRIAFVSFANLAALGAGESAFYSTPNSAGWYVTVASLGADFDNAGHTLYQVSIYSAGGSLAAQFTFSN